eukprot:s345_g5.t1
MLGLLNRGCRFRNSRCPSCRSHNWYRCLFLRPMRDPLSSQHSAREVTGHPDRGSLSVCRCRLHAIPRGRSLSVNTSRWKDSDR